MKPTHGLQEKPIDKSFKYNSRQPLVHRDCHQLPKPNMGAPHVLTPVVTIEISYEGEAKANILSLLGSYALMIGTLASVRNY